VHEPDVERGARDLPGVVPLDDDLLARIEEAEGVDLQTASSPSGADRRSPLNCMQSGSQEEA
jgi:hypothetical protein